MLNFEVWATPSYSLWEISDALSSLRVSHSLQGSALFKERVMNHGLPQTKWVHLTQDTHKLRASSINFISASYAELSLTNFPRLAEIDLAMGIIVMGYE